MSGNDIQKIKQQQNAEKRQLARQNFEDNLKRFWGDINLLPDGEWFQFGNCSGGSDFPESRKGRNGGLTPETRQMCGSCAVRQECLNYALLLDEYPTARSKPVRGGLVGSKQADLYTFLKKTDAQTEAGAEAIAKANRQYEEQMAKWADIVVPEKSALDEIEAEESAS